MNRRLIVAALLAVLAVLGGLEFLEDTGLIHYSTSELDRRVDDALDDYGEAVPPAKNGLNSSWNLQSSTSYGLDFPDLASPNPAHSLRRKHGIDFSKSAFNPLAYSQVLLV